MVIHVVKPGDSVYAIALEHGVPMSQIIADNELENPAQLVVGQTLVIQFPQQTHTVSHGETLTHIAQQYNTSLRALLQNNPALLGRTVIYPGQTLVIAYKEKKLGTLSVNGYAYPFIDKELLTQELPFLTNLTPFTYGITPEGGLVELEDEALIVAAQIAGVAPLMHLSTLTDDGGFSNELASLVLNDATVQKKLVNQVVETVTSKGYRGLDVDFEFVFATDAKPYADFIAHLEKKLNPLGYPVIAALAPKISPDQPGLLYEGHNYKSIGAAANSVLLMTYEWGYTYNHISHMR